MSYSFGGHRCCPARTTPPPLDLVPLFIFHFKLEHTFVLDTIMFTQALTFVPHLSLNGLFGMVHEHLSGCFILEESSLGFSELFQTAVIVAHGDIPRLVALVLGVSRLLVMTKDTNGLRLIIVGKVFFRFISRSIVQQLWGPFRSMYLHISLEYQPLEAMRPSFLASKPSSTYTVVESWCKSMLKMFSITFFKLLLLDNCVISKGL